MKTFRLADLVKINKELPVSMRHFTNDKLAIILSKNKDGRSFSLFIKDEGETAWYPKDTITLVKRNQSALLEKWEREFKILNKED